MTWFYDPERKRYRDSESGRTLNQNQVRGLVQQSIDAAASNLSGITSLAGSNQLSPADFNARMRDEIKYAYIREYVLGRGGLGQMTAEDWGSIGGMVADQYRYLGPFSEEITNLSEGQIAARAAMYIRSSREGYERAKVRAYGIAVDDLPHYPGQGDSQCLTNCKCHWSIDEVRDDGALIGFDCYWNLGPTEQHCADCTGYAAAYNPYPIRF
jgi:hypothetical protein